MEVWEDFSKELNQVSVDFKSLYPLTKVTMESKDVWVTFNKEENYTWKFVKNAGNMGNHGISSFQKRGNPYILAHFCKFSMYGFGTVPNVSVIKLKKFTCTPQNSMQIYLSSHNSKIVQ